MTGVPDAIDALLGAGPRRAVPLPAPAERERLRSEYGLTKTETAKALGASASTFGAWESGQREPQGEARAAYAKLLEGIAARLTPAPAATSVPGPLEQPASVTAPPVRAAFGGDQVVMLDQNALGELILHQPEPCVRCGRPTPYRAGGRPMHGGGWCSPATQTVGQVPAVAPAPVVAPVQQASQATAPAPAPAAQPTVAAPAAPRPSLRPAAPARARKAPAKKAAETGPADWELAAAARFPAGPLAVLDVAASGSGLVAHLTDGLVREVPGKSLADVTEWALGAGLGSARLHRHGKDGDPLVVVTDAAAAELGLPEVGKEKSDFDLRSNRLPDSHKVVKALLKTGWLLTQRGLGPWARVYRTPEGGRRECVQFCVPQWGALSAKDHWDIPEGLDAAGLARLLVMYATRVITPRGGAAVSGLELMTSLRPPTRAVRTESGWTSGLVEGSLHEAVDAAPPEVPAEHPLAQDRGPGPDEVIDEEAWDWHRPLEQLDPAETVLPYCVGVDLNTAYLAAAGRLVVGLSEPVHELNPAFDKRTPGSWLVDLSHVATDPKLPSPFTPSGQRPTEPAWYVTPTVAYAVELGAQVRPLEGWLRHESGPYLDPWHKRLRNAYVLTMANLGVPLDLADIDPQAFLEAMANLKSAGDPAELAVLHAIKQTAKGGIGKMRERPRGYGYKHGDRWSALDRPTWRPDIRAVVIATTRVNFHRKLAKTVAATGRYPLGVATDCVVYASPGPSALEVLPYGPDGKPVAGALRLGISPGHVKHEGTKPMAEILQVIKAGMNPARHIKGPSAFADDGE